MFKETTSSKNPSTDKDKKYSSISVKEFKRRTNGGFDFYDFVMRKKGVHLKNNNNFRLINPFYDDKRASMSINVVDGEYLFHDFGDEQYKGDVINFAGFYYNLNPKKDLPDIVERACKDLGINFSKSQTKQPEKPETQKSETKAEVQKLKAPIEHTQEKN